MGYFPCTTPMTPGVSSVRISPFSEVGSQTGGLSPAPVHVHFLPWRGLVSMAMRTVALLVSSPPLGPPLDLSVPACPSITAPVTDTHWPPAPVYGEPRELGLVHAQAKYTPAPDVC